MYVSWEERTKSRVTSNILLMVNSILTGKFTKLAIIAKKKKNGYPLLILYWFEPRSSHYDYGEICHLKILQYTCIIFDGAQK